MAKSVLDIVIKFQKQGDADRDTVRALTNIKSGVAEAMGVMSALAGVGYTLNAVYQNTVKVFQDYAFQVQDLSRVTGASMEDTSRLIQVADDLRISYEDLQKAMWFAAKNGTEVNIESLARLADEYNGFNSATERATFLNKTFGKGGAELAKLMELQGEGIDVATAAVQRNLIVTEQSARKAQALYNVTDALSDSFVGLAIAAGEILTVPIVAYLSIWQGAFESLSKAWSEMKTGPAETLEFFTHIWNTMASNVGMATIAVDDMRNMLNDLGGELETGISSADGFQEAMKNLGLMVSGELGKTYDEHILKLAELKSEMDAARTQQDSAGIQAQIDAETAAYERQTNAILFNIQSQALMRMAAANPELVEEILAINMALANSYGLMDERTMGAANSSNHLLSMWMNHLITDEQLVEGLLDVNRNIEQMAVETSEAAIATEKMQGRTKDAGAAAKGAQEPVDGLASSLNESGKQADYAAGEINQVHAQAKALDGMVAVVTIIVNTIGDMPSPGSFGPGQNVARCFAAGTLVEMADGTSKPIEQVKVGDVVQSMDVERREIVQAKVERTFEHPAGYAGVLLEVTLAGRSPERALKVTPEHMLYINGQWLPALSLRPGDELTSLDGESIRVVGVWRSLAADAVYNLETGHETHNYFAGGVLVHNGKSMNAAGGQWQPGDWALVGDMPGGGIGPYTEAIDPQGYIHSARETRILAAMGLFRGAKSLYAPEGTGSSSLDSSSRRRIRRPDGDTPFLAPGLRDLGFGGAGTMSGGTASLSDIVGPLQESAGTTAQAAQSAARASDQQAQQSVMQTDAIRESNAQVVDELQALRREMPDTVADAVKLAMGG